MRVPRSEILGPPSRPPPTCFGSCLVTATAVLIGFALGGLYGDWADRATFEEMTRRGELVDFLPVGIPVFGFLGAIVAAIPTVLLLIVRSYTRS
jgi:hypothetical protein